MNTLNDTANPTVEHGQADCLCPDDRCAGYHHEVGETCWCSVFTGTPDETDMVHPAECYGGNCVPEGGAMVEHHCVTQTMTTRTIFANGSLRVIASERDWRTDEFRSELPEISVSSPDHREVSTIKGRPEDLKALGKFIIEQAERFETILSSDAEVSA